MNKWLFSLVTTFALSSLASAEVAFEFAPDFIKPPAGKETIGDCHGGIAVDSNDKIYVSVDGQAEGGIQVYSPEGKYLESLKNVPSTMHGFVIHKEAAGEFIYGAVVHDQRVLKLKLDGSVALTIPKVAFVPIVGAIKMAVKGRGWLAGRISGETPTEVTFTQLDGSTQVVAKDQIGKKQHLPLSLTSVAVGSDGDIYVADGDGTDYIFQFDKDGKFKTFFGGRKEPYKLSNCHTICIDPRFSPERLLLCDRGNNRILHLSLAGEILGTIVDKGLRQPSSVSFYEDLMCVAESEGRISVWDKAGKMVAELGVNDTKGQANNPSVKPADWRPGIVTSPNGITFDAKGNIMETEWTKPGFRS